MSLNQKNTVINNVDCYRSGLCSNVSVLFVALYPFSFQQVATQATAKTRSSQFGVGNFQTPSSFSPMSLPGAPTASPGAATYPTLTNRGSNFGKFRVGESQEHYTSKRKMLEPRTHTLCQFSATELYPQFYCTKKEDFIVKMICLCPRYTDLTQENAR